MSGWIFYSYRLIMLRNECIPTLMQMFGLEKLHAIQILETCAIVSVHTGLSCPPSDTLQRACALKMQFSTPLVYFYVVHALRFSVFTHSDYSDTQYI